MSRKYSDCEFNRLIWSHLRPSAEALPSRSVATMVSATGPALSGRTLCRTKIQVTMRVNSMTLAVCRILSSP